MTCRQWKHHDLRATAQTCHRTAAPGPGDRGQWLPTGRHTPRAPSTFQGSLQLFPLELCPGSPALQTFPSAARPAQQRPKLYHSQGLFPLRPQTHTLRASPLLPKWSRGPGHSESPSPSIGGHYHSPPSSVLTWNLQNTLLLPPVQLCLVSRYYVQSRRPALAGPTVHWRVAWREQGVVSRKDWGRELCPHWQKQVFKPWAHRLWVQPSPWSSLTSWNRQGLGVRIPPDVGIISSRRARQCGGQPSSHFTEKRSEAGREWSLGPRTQLPNLPSAGSLFCH